MLDIYLLFIIGIGIGSVLLYGFTVEAIAKFFDYGFIIGAFCAVLAINGTYTTN